MPDELHKKACPAYSVSASLFWRKAERRLLRKQLDRADRHRVNASGERRLRLWRKQRRLICQRPRAFGSLRRGERFRVNAAGPENQCRDVLVSLGESAERACISAMRLIPSSRHSPMNSRVFTEKQGVGKEAVYYYNGDQEIAEFDGGPCAKAHKL